jgi:hypothetical protein
VNFLQEIQTWWRGVTPEMQSAIQGVCVLALAGIGGHFLAKMVVRTLRVNNFDALLRLPGSPSPSQDERRITPTLIGGWLVRLTVWAGAGWWLAHQNGRVDLTNTIGLILSRTWAITTVLVAALALGSVLAHRLIDCVQAVKSDAARNGSTTSGSQRGAAGAVGAAAYILVILVVLLIASDLFNWPLTRNSALALWGLAQNLLIAGAALFIGCLGARWARDLAASTATSTPEQQAGQYTAMGIVAATTVLAVAVLLSSAGVLIGLAALAILGFMVWLVRGYLPDIIAGLQLRTHKVSEVWSDGMMWQVTEIGFLKTQVCRGGDVIRLPNRVALEARFQGPPAEQNGAEQNGAGLTGAKR